MASPQKTKKDSTKASEQPISFVHSLFGRLFLSSLILTFVPVGVSLYVMPPAVLKPTPLLVLFFFILLFALSLSFILSQSIARPIAVLIDALRRLKAGDYTIKAPTMRKDEIGRLENFFYATVGAFLETQQRDTALSEIKSQFVTVAAHQLRTPLSGMKWTLRLLLDGDIGSDLTEKQREFLQHGYQTTERMIRLVNDFLDISRVEEGRFGFHFKKVRIVDVIKKVVADIRLSAEAQGVSIAFQNTDVPEDLEIIADEERIYTATTNIVDNAIRYNMKDGEATVVIALKDDMLEVRVADTGIGIPAGEQPKIFSRFYRASNAVRRQTEGSGLGLYIVRNIIRRHGGRVWFLSAGGKGTVFYFTLPVKEDFIRNQNLPSEFLEAA